MQCFFAFFCCVVILKFDLDLLVMAACDDISYAVVRMTKDASLPVDILSFFRTKSIFNVYFVGDILYGTEAERAKKCGCYKGESTKKNVHPVKEQSTQTCGVVWDDSVELSGRQGCGGAASLAQPSPAPPPEPLSLSHTEPDDFSHLFLDVKPEWTESREDSVPSPTVSSSRRESLIEQSVSPREPIIQRSALECRDLEERALALKKTIQKHSSRKLICNLCGVDVLVKQRVSHAISHCRGPFYRCRECRTTVTNVRSTIRKHYVKHHNATGDLIEEMKNRTQMNADIDEMYVKCFENAHGGREEKMSPEEVKDGGAGEKDGQKEPEVAQEESEPSEELPEDDANTVKRIFLADRPGHAGVTHCMLCTREVRRNLPSLRTHIITHISIRPFYKCSMCSEASHYDSVIKQHVSTSHCGEAEMIDESTAEKVEEVRVMSLIAFPRDLKEKRVPGVPPPPQQPSVKQTRKRTPRTKKRSLSVEEDDEVEEMTEEMMMDGEGGAEVAVDMEEGDASDEDFGDDEVEIAEHQASSSKPQRRTRSAVRHDRWAEGERLNHPERARSRKNISCQYPGCGDKVVVYGINSLQNHASIHCGVKFFGCTVCGYQSNKREDLMSMHITRVHQDMANPAACVVDLRTETTIKILNETVEQCFGAEDKVNPLVEILRTESPLSKMSSEAKEEEEDMKEEKTDMADDVTERVEKKYEDWMGEDGEGDETERDEEWGDDDDWEAEEDAEPDDDDWDEDSARRSSKRVSKRKSSSTKKSGSGEQRTLLRDPIRKRVPCQFPGCSASVVVSALYNLQQHAATHCGIKYFACSICGHQYNKRNCLIQTHIMQVHRDEPNPAACIVDLRTAEMKRKLDTVVEQCFGQMAAVRGGIASPGKRQVPLAERVRGESPPPKKIRHRFGGMRDDDEEEGEEGAEEKAAGIVMKEEKPRSTRSTRISMESGRSVVSDGRKKVTCRKCDKLVYNAPSEKRHHALTHTSIVAHKCPSCEYTCNYQSNMVSHIKGHNMKGSRERLKSLVIDLWTDEKRAELDAVMRQCYPEDEKKEELDEMALPVQGEEEESIE